TLLRPQGCPLPLTKHPKETMYDQHVPAEAGVVTVSANADCTPVFVLCAVHLVFPSGPCCGWAPGHHQVHAPLCQCVRNRSRVVRHFAYNPADSQRPGERSTLLSQRCSAVALSFPLKGLTARPGKSVFIFQRDILWQSE
ncbi:hypothetical protein BaRGS_00002852, partial [Batillaria attramentaria]